MYRHIKNYRLKYTDVDAFDRLKLSSLLSCLEESACLSADELGFGYDNLAPVNLGFILVNIYIKFERAINLGETLTVHTWPLRPKYLVFLRDSELYVGDEKVGCVTARWCMIDTITFSVTPASAYFKDGDFDNYNTERSVDFSGWKIPSVTQGEECYCKKVTYSDYDHYQHVNNTKYADFLMDVFSVDELKNRAIDSVQITYVKQCKEGERIDIVRSEQEGYYLVEGRVCGDLRVQMRVKFNDV